MRIEIEVMMNEELTVSLKNGQLLQGSTKIDSKGKPYYGFQGIPYGKPPIGELRFKAPQPADSWTGVKDATTEGNKCYSRDIFRQITGSEDCLFLNIYTPELPSDASTLRPVMVWVHGGNFIGGSGDSDFFGPDFLIAEDVVVVTINYRLGILGFASFEDPSIEIPGNAGLKDQVLALKWVQQYIKKFSGDPGNVTIFGNSAGGASVHLLMLSPLAKGLFHRVIAQSGVATAMWAKAQHTAPLVAEALGLKSTQEKDIAEILIKMPVDELFELQEKIPDPLVVHSMRPFGPVVESSDEGSTFLSKQPEMQIKAGEFNHVPLMVGYNSKEGMLLLQQFEAWNSNFEYSIPHELKLRRGSDLSKKVAEMLRQFYYGNEIPSRENIQQYYNLQTDCAFFIHINKAVRHHIESSSAPVYYYRLSADTRLNIFKNFLEITDAGTAHGDDPGYLFKTILTPDVEPNSPEDIARSKIIKLWTTFARYGNPNPIDSDPLIAINWPSAERDRLHFLDIGENLTVGCNPEYERVELWEKIYDLCRATPKL